MYIWENIKYEIVTNQNYAKKEAIFLSRGLRFGNKN